MPVRDPRRRSPARRRAVIAAVMASEDICWLCGRPVDKTLPPRLPGSPEVDEDIPVSRGGSPFDRANCHLVHKACNLVKHNHSTAWARARLGHPDAVRQPGAADTAAAIKANRPFD